MDIESPSTCVIYCRISQDRDGVGAGVERQEADCRALAKRLNLEVDHVHIENDTSATRGRRPEFESMMASRPEAILAWHQDRLLRKTADLERVIDQEVPIYFVQSSDLELSTPAGRAVARTVAAWSQYEMEQKGIRRSAANLQRAREGEWAFSRRPYGYERKDGQVTQKPDEIPHVQFAYDAYIQGQTYKAIAEQMNAEGATTTNGAAWTAVMVQDLLANPRYSGHVVYKEEIFPEAKPQWEPAIPKETYLEYETIRAQRKQKGRPSAGRPKHLLSGFLECSECGSSLYAHYVMRRRRKDGTRADPYLAYDCMERRCVSIQAVRLEELVVDVVLHRLADPRVAERLEKSSDTSKITTELTEKSTRRREIAALVADGLLTPADARDELQTLKARIEALNRRLEETRQGSPLHDLVSSESMRRKWDELSLIARRRILDAMGLRVVVKPINEEDRGKRFVDPITGEPTVNVDRLEFHWGSDERRLTKAGLRVDSNSA